MFEIRNALIYIYIYIKYLKYILFLSIILISSLNSIYEHYRSQLCTFFFVNLLINVKKKYIYFYNNIYIILFIIMFLFNVIIFNYYLLS